MPESNTQNHAKHIHEATDADTAYVLHPDDNDLFVRTGRQVIASCQLGISVELWLTELSAMMKSVHDWASQRGERIQACYCAPLGTSVVFFFAPKSSQFDFDLADGLAELNLELLRKFNIGVTEMRQIPWEEFDRFVNPLTTRWLYGEQLKPLETVDT